MLATALLLAVVGLPRDARGLPHCGPAFPDEVGVAGQAAFNAWKSYQQSSPENRCCAKNCLPLGEYAGILEENADALNRTARNAKVPAAERKLALDAFNGVNKKRNDVTAQFRLCQTQALVRGTGALRHCGKIAISPDELAWARICRKYAQKVDLISKVFIDDVGNNLGSWQLQTNWFRINRFGELELNSLFVSPTTRLTPGQTADKYMILLQDTDLGRLPDDTRMYMRMTIRAIRTPGPAGTDAVLASKLIDGPCPGPINRPVN
jgi:hypothetical protein